MINVNIPMSISSLKVWLQCIPVNTGMRTANDKGSIKRVDRHTWVLFADGISNRSRWGNLDQMAEDLLHFEQYGVLPEPEKYQYGL